MNIIKPKNLEKGDTISIIATSGHVDKNAILNAQSYFNQKGYKVKLGKNIFKEHNYLAGEDSERLEDLHNAFFDSETKAIICARGGYGALRLVNKIDYEIVKSNPKIFCGYSDITILNAMFLKRANLMTYSGAMAQSDFGIVTENFTVDKFFNALTGNITSIIPTNIKKYNNIDKDAQGITFGGNLASLVSLCGIEFIPDENFILFIEDLNEPVYKIDRYLQQLLNISEFKDKLQGIILGDFLDVDNQKYFDDLFFELSKKLNIPICSGYKISHAKEKLTIPYGAKVILSKDGILKF